jgi:hypothetical protein
MKSLSSISSRPSLVLAAALVVLGASACVARGVVAGRVALGSDAPRAIQSAAKAQLIDGSLVTFPDGFRVDSGRVVGDGWRYGLTLHDSVRVTSIAVDSVAGMVAFRTAYDPAKSVGMTVAAAVTTFFALAIAAIVGCVATSCLR